MLVVHTALHGYTIAARDGDIGTVADFLFDDRSWQCRWLVVETGNWLAGRKVLLHPSVLGHVDHDLRFIPVDLTKQTVQDSPPLEAHQPVSRQFELTQYDYYGWDPYWGSGLYGYSGASVFAGPPRYFGGVELTAASDINLDPTDADPNLRSMVEISSYAIHASDGDIGHVENMLIDDATWGVRYLIVDRSNWWFGKRVLMSPYAITGINYDTATIAVNVTRAAVKESPVWDPIDLVNQDIQHRLHTYYGWPGYGW